jgi:hypothetical protein
VYFQLVAMRWHQGRDDHARSIDISIDGKRGSAFPAASGDRSGQPHDGIWYARNEVVKAEL